MPRLSQRDRYQWLVSHKDCRVMQLAKLTDEELLIEMEIGCCFCRDAEELKTYMRTQGKKCCCNTGLRAEAERIKNQS